MAAVRAAISVGDIDAASLRNETLAACVDGLQCAAQADVLKADHYRHMRLEFAEENLLAMFEPCLQDDRLRLVSLMDHTPGQRRVALQRRLCRQRLQCHRHGYRGRWNATDQIPRRAVGAGQIGRFDALDPSDGGTARRDSLSGAWRRTTDTSFTNVSAYLVRNELDLYSNFTYFLDDPVHGDQFNQRDQRTTAGLNASHSWSTPLFGRASETTVGMQLQNDNILNGLYHTVARQRLSTTRADHVVESSAGLYLENTTRWAEKLRTIAGIRHDFLPLRCPQRQCA